MRALLRRSDDGARREALASIERWNDGCPEPRAASAILRAATLAYPWVRTQRSDPGLQLARVLCGCPRQVDVAEVEAAYLVSAEPVRRALLHLLALRRDPVGIGSLSYLLGPDGPEDLLPLPTGGLLSPSLDVVSAPELVPSLIHVASRPGWAWHAAELLAQLVRDDRLDEFALGGVVRGLEPVVSALVDACDRAGRGVGAGSAGSAGSGSVASGGASTVLWRGDGSEHRRHPVSRDPSRGDRFRLRSLVDLYSVLPSKGAVPVLRRVMSSADPRPAATGLVALVRHGAEVAPERCDLLARDAEARAELIDGLIELDELDRLSPQWRDGRARAEAELVRWLAADTELGVRPDEIEHVTALDAGDHPDDGVVHLFRFRLRPPHWSSARGWMVGAAGPFCADGSLADQEPFACSVYFAEDEEDIDGHLDSILDSLGTWYDGDDG